MQARPRQRPRRGLFALLRALISGLFQMAVAALAMTGIVAIVLGAWLIQSGYKPSSILSRPQLVSAAKTLRLPEAVVDRVPQARPVVYLNREGGVITAGNDDASHNSSSVVARAGLEQVEIPEFRGSVQRWDAIVSCVQRQFAPYDIEIVDTRPVEGDYIMAMIGGRAGELATGGEHNRSSRSRTTGLAPMSLTSIDDAVVFVFSRELRESTNAVCDTTAHEIGHALGLDHVLDCRDPMSYLPRCARRSFQDRERSCGERSARQCADGSPTQNSHQHLLELLGPRKPEEPATAGSTRP